MEKDHNRDLARSTSSRLMRAIAYSSSALIHLCFADLALFLIACAEVISFDARLIKLLLLNKNVPRVICICIRASVFYFLG